jgi:predicted O-linked N-acetylglucosamine transferase (SPINDLY family)
MVGHDQQWTQAVTLHRAGQHAAAEKLYLGCLAMAPERTDVLYALGRVYYEQGKLDESIQVLSRAVKLAPLNSSFRYSLASILQMIGKYPEAEKNFRKILEIDQDHTAAHIGLGINLYNRDHFISAIELFSRAGQLEPENQKAHYNLALAYIRAGDTMEADASLRRALEINPHAAAIHSCYLLNLHYHGTLPNRQVFSEHHRWAQLHEAPLARHTMRPERRTVPGRKTRIAYVSADFRRHSVASFITPVLRAHDHRRFEIICYSDVKNPDGVTERIKSYADEWYNVCALDDRQLAEKIHSDGIDIFVDLAGHTNGNRLLAFAYRPAPVQLTYLGYPDTTGMSAMDARITDHWADPAGDADQYCSERLVRLPGGFLCYEPPVAAPEVSSLPAQASGQITFGSFNNLAKITPQAVSAWSEILAAVPDSRLLIKARGLDDARLGEGLKGRFLARGVSAGRIELSGHITDYADHLGYYRRVDVALDTFPYNGTTTTCEALWMGVPVITLAGNNHAGRVGSSLLSRLGLEAYIAGSRAAYVGLAVEQAGKVDELASFRAGLRGRMLDSPLTNPESLCRELEAAYTEMLE